MSSPLRFTWKTEIFPLLLIVVSGIASLYFYQHFPARVPTHWNINGQVDGYSSRGFAAFFFPLLNLGMYVMFLALPYLDPKKEKYGDFARVYHIFKDVLIAFMTYIYLLVGMVGIGYSIDINRTVPSAIGLLFIILGNYMTKIRPNWFMGIRTPWTLSNDEVWRKTHRLGGKLFMLAGAVAVIGFVLPVHAVWYTFFVAIAVAAIVPMVYSYIFFKQIKK